MNLKTIREEINRVRAGYSPKTYSFWIWLFYTINGTVSILALRVRMVFK